MRLHTNLELEITRSESDTLFETGQDSAETAFLREQAKTAALTLSWLPNTTSSSAFMDRCKQAGKILKPLLAKLVLPPPGTPVADDVRWLYDNSRLLCSELQSTATVLKRLKKIPHVRTPEGKVIPRVLAIAEAFLEASAYDFSQAKFTLFVEACQETTVLHMRELWALVPAMKLALLEQIAARSLRLMRERDLQSCGVGIRVRSLRDITQSSWKEVLEPLILFDQVLRQDPAGAYSKMDFDSRDLYRNKLSKIAEHSDFSEMDVAGEVVALAREASRKSYNDPRLKLRESHIGYYLVGKGVRRLYARVGFRPSFVQKLRGILRNHPDEVFLLGIELLTFALMSAVVLLLTDAYTPPLLILLSILMLLLPSSQTAIQLVNYLITTVLSAEILPKLDFSEEIPADCVTMVAVPSLLLNERQVHGLVQDLEVRFLGNHNPNIHFALLTDLPDAREPEREDSPLVDLCAELIRQLNERYPSRRMGSFFMFHRHRVYNPREKSWMGWERKRGKLLDLNKLLRGQYDSFPVKVGDLSILPRVRFVITLDADTELPRGTAHRMIGTMMHPLNQAIIDPEKNIVVAGYGILQPRVGVSVQSTAVSRMAAIYAGETGFDIYTRAVSDVYQDLYGEGSYTGKGIYEVDALHRVLDRRFPRNALLSHDLIEGAYARAGLASDIEVIEDYPSHYSAYNRRRHRWLRGDWQIAGWLFPRVPDESGTRVPNPISLISWWKIFDNLRRSLVEPATFLLLVFGWFVLGHSALQWTLATVCILFIPPWCHLLINLVRAAVERSSIVAREALSTFYAGNINVVLTLVFLGHQTLLSLDAVVRALVRRMFTGRRLLEWETAAEAESATRRRTPLDAYLDWMPALALGLILLILVVRPAALAAALPILLLWAANKLISNWLNRPPVAPRNEASRKDVVFLRRAALHTWRYFAEFSTEEHNWLIPDNVQQDPPAVAARISPTNLGLLLNGRQVACELGYLTLPEFAEHTLRTLASVAKLPKFRGHLLNWYDTRTLQPLDPVFVSSVDSGNMLASLWTLQHGCMERLRQPVLQPRLSEGLIDYLRILAERRIFPMKVIRNIERQRSTQNWLNALLELSGSTFDTTEQALSKSKRSSELRWFADEARARVRAIRETVPSYAPWFLPEFSTLRNDPALNLKLLDRLALEQVPGIIDKLRPRLATASIGGAAPEQMALYHNFDEYLVVARANIVRLIEDVRSISAEAARLANEMDFAFLLNRHRKMMSVGFDVESQRLHSACYDLLATESRTAIFAAIAKEDIPQESWFLLGRSHTLDHGRPVLLSWTGTMFEYLMPGLWMRSYSNTLLQRSRVAAVRAQQTYAFAKGVPWGISESAYFKLDEAGNYQYHAFGLPHLSLRKAEFKALVISPYSTFLALNVDPSESFRNLQRMKELGWFGAYGFYEAADYTTSRRRFWGPRYKLVKTWMAHHQGMSLLAAANFLTDNVVQRWFHSDRRVQATELLLHEKPVSHVRRKDIAYVAAAA